MSQEHFVSWKLHDLAELRDAAENDGTSATTVYIGGPGWDAVRALIRVVDAANDLTLLELPKGRKPSSWYDAHDRLITTLDAFENRGDE